MMRWGSSGQAADSFYQVRPDCSQNVPSTRFKIKVSELILLNSFLPVPDWFEIQAPAALVSGRQDTERSEMARCVHA